MSKISKYDEEPGFLEEEESFKGDTDDDQDVPKSPQDELETLAEETAEDRLDNEEDSKKRDREDMMEQGRLSSIHCAACGAFECLGHEENSVNHSILIAHKSEDHSSCHPDGCKLAGKSFHTHVCKNCGGDSPCNGVKVASVCDTFTEFCKKCFVSLARVEHIALNNQELNEWMRKRNVAQPPVTQDEVDHAMGAGHSLETAREKVGPHRPAEKDASTLPDWLEDAKIQIEADKSESSDSFVPPESVASAAKRGLELRRKHNRGGTEVGVARARDLSNRKGLSYKTVKRMKAYFDRHEVDKKGEGWGKDSAGYIAWLLWGGDSGRSWANKIIKQREKESKTASNECGTCGHGWSAHGKSTSCSCCAEFKNSNISFKIESNADIIDFEQARLNKGKLTPSEERMNAMKRHPSNPDFKPSLSDKMMEKLFDMHVDYNQKTLDPHMMNIMKKNPVELYDQDTEAKLYDQDREANPISNSDNDEPNIREQFEALGDWLGLTDDPTKPYNRKTDPRQYDL